MKMQLLAIAIVAGLVAPPSPIHAQEKLTLEEKRQEAHQGTLKKFNALKAAHAAKEKADCDGAPEEKKKANSEYVRARQDFYAAVEREASYSDAGAKAVREFDQAMDEKDEANKNASIPKEYKKEAEKKPQKRLIRCGKS